MRSNCFQLEPVSSNGVILGSLKEITVICMIMIVHQLQHLDQLFSFCIWMPVFKSNERCSYMRLYGSCTILVNRRWICSILSMYFLFQGDHIRSGAILAYSPYHTPVKYKIWEFDCRSSGFILLRRLEENNY